MPTSLHTATHWTRVVLGEGRPAVQRVESAGLGAAPHGARDSEGHPLAPSQVSDNQGVGVASIGAGAEHRARYAAANDLRRGIIVRYRAA